MTLNLISQRNYYCDGNNRYFCRSKYYGQEIAFEVSWKVWCNEANEYKEVISSELWRKLEDEYLK